MGNENRTWFLDNVTSLIRGLYFSTRPNVQSMERWIGYLLAWSSVILAVGGSPDTFMAPEDIQTLRAEMNRR